MGAVFKIGIVIPCYNEAERLPVREFIKYAKRNDDVHFIFVNDGSTDDTQSLVDGLVSANQKSFSVVTLDKNRGKAAAVRAGFSFAFKKGIPLIGYWDADLAAPLNAIKELCALVKNDVCLVMGARVKLLGRDIRRRSFRHYTGRFFAMAVSLILDLPVYDTQCGAKVFKNTPDIRRIFSRPFTVRWIFDVEILTRMRLIERATKGPSIEESVVEYPLMAWRDVKGSKVTLPGFLTAIFDLLTIYRILHLPALSPYRIDDLTSF